MLKPLGAIFVTEHKQGRERMNRTIRIFTSTLIGLLLILTSAGAQNRTWVVSIEGQGDFRLIRQAISKAIPGDTIKIRGGVYRERLRLRDNITLIGESREQTILTNLGNNPIITSIEKSDISLKNLRFRFTGTFSQPALWFVKGSGIHIERCRIEGAGTNGIELNATEAIIKQCEVSDCSGSAIYAYSGSEVQILRCLLRDNGKQGIAVDSSKAIIKRNTIVRNKGGGVWFYHASQGEIFNSILAGNEFGLAISKSSRVDMRFNNYWKNRQADYRWTTDTPNRRGKYVSEVIPEPKWPKSDLHVDPSFVDFAMNNFYLKEDSPLIGKGSFGETIGAFPGVQEREYDMIAPEIILMDCRVITYAGGTIDSLKADFTRGISVRADSLKLVVRGLAKDQSKVIWVTVAGRDAELSPIERGVKFEARVPLIAGENEVVIKAADEYGNVGEHHRSIEVTPTSLPQIWALIVGVSQYRDSRLNLLYADRDAKSFYNFLRSPAGSSVPEEQIILLLNAEATRAKIVKSLVDLVKRAQQKDMVIIFMALHGIPSFATNKLYFMPHDGELDNVDGTGIAMVEVADNLQRLTKGKVLLLFDACHSGAYDKLALAYGQTRGDYASLVNKFLRELAKIRKGIGVLAACRETEVSFENEKWGGGHGAFTYFLLKGLKGEADKDHDGLVRLDEIEDYVRAKVRSATNYLQTPELDGDLPDKLPLAIVEKATQKEEEK